MSTGYNNFSNWRVDSGNILKKKSLKPEAVNSIDKGLFVHRLLHWNRMDNNRTMPWKGEKNPYKIWLSEIILQQTRVEQGLGYYNRFLQAMPTVQHLAAAPEQQVFKLWEGLGYYSRCRNLIATAKLIVADMGGHFPATYGELLELKGIGPYTAAAIASFAYNLPYAVLDGNVFRVLSRIYAAEIAVNSTAGKSIFSKLAQSLLPQGKAAEYNQAVMDFGATICKPMPQCNVCFFNDHCLAFLAGKQNLLPIKIKQAAVKQRWFYYFMLQHKGFVAIRLRQTKDIWQGLYEPLLMETNGEYTETEWKSALEKEFGIHPKDYTVKKEITTVHQRLTHQMVHFYFINLQLKSKPILQDFQWVAAEKVREHAFPKTIALYLDKNL